MSVDEFTMKMDAWFASLPQAKQDEFNSLMEADVQ